ncbi:MAG TPA: UDP-N-acetylmuramoyl-L-alanine--D-glutamate ligase [Thermoanaerobaculia bacterium]|nr:UDP-N-acetylmuramoyl-L-alanine--D-glutamate ligase [Thermoanaerobaculia bacterium]
MRVPWGSGRFERVLVYGLGLSGRAAARLLLDRGVAVLAADDRAEIEPGDLAGEPKFELMAAAELDSRWERLGPIDAVVVSPGVPPGRPLLAEARRRGLPVLAEVELAFPLLNGPVAAITGTNGKSTTTALTGSLLAAAGFAVEVCGNIGEPLSARVEGPPGRIFVVELSSFQIEGLHTFRPRAAAFLNLAEDHLDRYGDLASYAAAKGRLFRDQEGGEGGAGDTAVLNADDPITAAVAARSRRRLFSRRVRVADGCFAAAGTVVEVAPGEPDRELFAVSQVPLAGVQNLENAMAAALLALAMGAERAALAGGLARFSGLPHRMQQVALHGGVAFYDDSKGTNPAATAKSLEGFRDASVHLILGGRNKGADLGSLAPLVGRKARRVYLIGEAAAELERALAGAAPLELAETLERAVRSAAVHAAPGEAVVLSPACASFDQFRNFAHRGESFQQQVRAVLAAAGAGGAGEAAHG